MTAKTLKDCKTSKVNWKLYHGSLGGNFLRRSVFMKEKSCYVLTFSGVDHD